MVRDRDVPVRQRVQVHSHWLGSGEVQREDGDPGASRYWRGNALTGTLPTERGSTEGPPMWSSFALVGDVGISISKKGTRSAFRARGRSQGPAPLAEPARSAVGGCPQCTACVVAGGGSAQPDLYIGRPPSVAQLLYRARAPSPDLVQLRTTRSGRRTEDSHAHQPVPKQKHAHMQAHSNMCVSVCTCMYAINAMQSVMCCITLRRRVTRQGRPGFSVLVTISSLFISTDATCFWTVGGLWGES